MKPYKFEYQKFEMLHDRKPNGKEKQKIRREVRFRTEREWKNDLKNEEKEDVRSQQKDEEKEILGRTGTEGS